MSDTAFKIGLLVLGVCGAAGTWFRAWVAWRTYTGQSTQRGDCSECNGLGYFMPGQRDCPRCFGSGGRR